ncbi:MAG TPA: hypothetical protein VGK93_08645 [Candidatus Eisenbacteria bacterium]|jgi:hypothetical protein
MERRSAEAVIEALNRAEVRYLVAGGLAVVAHGLVRFTADIDLVLDPEQGAMTRAITALSGLGYRPRAPVEFAEFADPAKRRQWSLEKGMTVFSAFSPEHPATEIDLFVEIPFDFEGAYRRAVRLEFAPGLHGTFVGLTDLIEMKRAAARPQDLQDVAGLESLRVSEDSDA